MVEQVSGFPYWELQFDDAGRLTDANAGETLLGDLPGQQLSDVFVFSHGWNNDRATARDLYARL